MALLWLATGLTLSPATIAIAQDALQPGEAFVTRFSGTAMDGGRAVIDVDGTVGSIIELRNPGSAPQGAQWSNEPQRSEVTAGQVGQVFGIAIDDAETPSIFITATSAFGLHRNADNTDWMAGMWGPDGGPGTVWKLNGADGQPEAFANITLDGRANSGAALGNIAYDRWNKQFFVSDLETGMIHRLRAADGTDLGHYDHGTDGRPNFFDAETDGNQSLTAVPFNTGSSARLSDCPTGDFARTPSCWNFADFRRRVWGVGVRRDPSTKDVRLYYSVWSSQAFGNPDYAGAGDDQRNAVWSVRIGDDGAFDTSSVRREFYLPDFFRSPEAIARAGASHPVTDIAFPAFSDEPIMLLAERGGVRNLGLSAENAFAYPNEARVLRYQLNSDGIWEPVGRYDIGFYDRKNEGPPYVRASAAGGATFGLGYTDSWEIDPAKPNSFVWMTGDGLCSSKGPCLDANTKKKTDTSEVHGLAGREQSAYEEVVPEAAFQPYPAPGPATPSTGPDRSFLIDVDANGDSSHNDATRIGDVEVYQPQAKSGDLKITKKAEKDRCDQGAECTFNIEIENVGELTYEGPLEVRDVADGSATLVSHTPEEWTCEPVFSETTGSYTCSHPGVMLAPGEKTTLELTFQLPDWWTRRVYKNCAALSKPSSPADEHTYNNESCDYVPVCEPDEEYCVADLKLEKFNLNWNCNWLGVCQYVVRVTNVGAGDYTGPLHIHDFTPSAGAVLTDFEPRPPWDCGPLGGDTVDCTHPDVTLTPGDFREVIVSVQRPPFAPGIDEYVDNCARIEWDDRPHDFNPGNEYACSGVSRYPSGHPDARPSLAILKTGWPTCNDVAGPPAHWECHYTVTITNIGGAPYFGPLQVSDTLNPAAADLQEYWFEPPWTCVPGVGGGGVQTCSRPGVPGGLLPGQSEYLYLGFELPPGPAGGAERNCATIRQDANGDGVLEDYTSCFTAFKCEPGSPACPKDLAIDKSRGMMVAAHAPHSGFDCWPGYPCEFQIIVTNLGDHDYPGPLHITDVTTPSGMAPVIVGPPEFGCVDGGGGEYHCTYNALIPAGDTVWLAMEIPIPADYPHPSLENCARIPPDADFNRIPDNDESCWTAWVPQPDIGAFGHTECRRGESCEIEVGLKNHGKLVFKGKLGLRGTLSPAVPITAIRSHTPGFSCSVIGDGEYECRGDQLVLKPGQEAGALVTISIPADFPHSSIAEVNETLWLDRAVKDKNPVNDKDETTITIIGPVEPEEPEQPPPQARPDLAVSKSARSGRCTAGQSCKFSVKVSNVSDTTFEGPLTISDTIDPDGTRLVSYEGGAWTCSGSGGSFTCSHGSTTLSPGAAKTLNLIFATPQKSRGRVENCATLSWGTGRVASVLAVQQTLAAQGFDPGTPDGRMGAQTRSAIRAFQKSRGLRVTGQIDDALTASLFGGEEGDANSGNDSDCASVRLQAAVPESQPEPEPEPEPIPEIVVPKCDPGWKKVSAGESRSLEKKGWSVEKKRATGITIYCVRPPQPCPKCYERSRKTGQCVSAFECHGGSKKVAGKAKGLPVFSCTCPSSRPNRVKINDCEFACKPPVVICKSPAFKVGDKCSCPSKAYKLKRLPGPNTFTCEKVVTLKCPSGWDEVPRQKAKALVKKGYQVKQVREGRQSIMCVKPPDESGQQSAPSEEIGTPAPASTPSTTPALPATTPSTTPSLKVNPQLLRKTPTLR